MKRHILILAAILFVFSSVLTSCNKDETVNVTGITLNKASLSLKLGETEVLTATVSPSDAADKSITWVSSNTSIATVDNNGKITTVAEGYTVITVATTDGGYSATCAVTVEAAEQPESTEPTLTVTFGSVQWTATYIEAEEYTSSSGNMVGVLGFKTEGYYPYINFGTLNETGTTNENFYALYYESGYVEYNSNYYGDWYIASGTATVTKYLGGKLSGTINAIMYDLDDYLNNGNENPETRSLTIAFENISIDNATKMVKAMNNSIEKFKELKSRKPLTIK